MPLISVLRNAKRIELFIPSVLSLFFIIIITSNSQFFVSADLLLAQVVKQQYDLGNDYNSVGLFNFINYHFPVLYVVPVCSMVYIAATEVIYYAKRRSGESLRQLLIVISYFALLICAFWLFVFALEKTLKVSLNRPRPRETLTLAKTYNACLVNYTGFLQQLRGDNPCGLHFYSCPSGHTMEVNMILLAATYSLHYYSRYCRSMQRTAMYNASRGLTVLSLLLLTVFAPAVLISRIIDFAHYLGDVSLGLGCAYLFTFFWGLFEPDWELFAARGDDKEGLVEESLV